MEARNSRNHFRALVILFAIAGGVSSGLACAPAVVGAGAGVAGTAYATTRGAKAVVKGTPATLEATSERVLSEMDIPVTDAKTEKGGAHRELKGKKEDKDVTITIDRRDDGTSDVEVTARKNPVEWDKDFAESLLNKIIKET